MPLDIITHDITKMKVDAIVNAANPSLLGGGGVDGAIHRAAGKGLLAECMTLGWCKTGCAEITGAYDLPCKFVIHTVGPIYRGGGNGEQELLRSCYVESLKLARDRGCETIAFPLISSGAYSYPFDEALDVAVEAISEFLLECDLQVYLVIFDRSAYRVEEGLYSAVSSYIEDHFVGDDDDFFTDYMCSGSEPPSFSARRRFPKNEAPVLHKSSVQAADIAPTAYFRRSPKSIMNDLEKELDRLDESFSQMLLRKIDEKGMTDVQCYNKANLDRKLFSKIRSDIHYRPSKRTALSLAIALELSLPETEAFLRKAGFALSHSNKFDVIVEFFIKEGIYDVHKINEVLFAYDQVLLGG